MADGTLEFDTRIDESGFNKGIGSLESAATKAGDIMSGILGAKWVEKAGEAIGQFARKAIDMASDLEEVQNVVDVAFGDMSGEIDAFAKTTSSQFGLTELQTKNFSGTIGAMLNSMGLAKDQVVTMSKDMVGLTGDIASFYNLDHETAFNKIRAGLSGETEPLKQLGINLSQANLEAFALAEGIKTAYKDMTEAEKITLRYNYIMKTTADAQGDFARTSDGFANQMRLLQNNIDSFAASLGQLLLPAANAAVTAINSIFEIGSGEDNTLLSEIKAAADAINGENGLEAQVKAAKEKLARENIQIRVTYNSATNALEELRALQEEYENTEVGYGDRTLKLGMSGDDVTALQNQLVALGYAVDLANEAGTFGESTDAALRAYQTDMGLVVDGIAGVNTYASLASSNTAKMAEKTAELVKLYPELAEYVGEDGLFTNEIDQVQDLIDKYAELARMKAYEAMLGDMSTAYYAAEMNYEILAAKQEEAANAYEKAAEKKSALDALWTETENGGSLQATSDAAQNYANYAKWIQSYIDIMGGLDGVNLDGLSLDSITDLDGNILQEGGDFNSLFDLYERIAIGNGTADVETELKNAGDAFKTATDEAVAAIDTLEAARNEYDIGYNLYQDKFGETGETIDREIADGVVSHTELTTAAVDDMFDSAIAEANKRATELNNLLTGLRTGISPRSHAAGLNYVPYDNYRANLHVGEAVLNASEAARWRAGQSGGIDYNALAQAVARASAGSDRPIVLEVDGKALAKATAADNRTAINSYNRRIAQGVGK